MLSYLHEFHAGNHADILKHFVLFRTIKYLNKKDKPYSFFDTHSGSALYDIKSEKAYKTGEAASGIEKLLSAANENPSSVPEILKDYLSFVDGFVSEGLYPGSPVFESMCVLPESKVYLTELHKAEHEKLCSNMKKIKGVRPVIKNVSGWTFIKGNVPPPLKRGGILCDPSYEDSIDYENAALYLSGANERWSGATILLWYPFLANRKDEIRLMKEKILSSVKKKIPSTEVLDIRLFVDTEDSHVETELKDSIGSAKPRLYGSGMFVVNPSWTLMEDCRECLPYLSKTLGREGNGSFCVEML